MDDVKLTCSKTSRNRRMIRACSRCDEQANQTGKISKVERDNDSAEFCTGGHLSPLHTVIPMSLCLSRIGAFATRSRDQSSLRCSCRDALT